MKTAKELLKLREQAATVERTATVKLTPESLAIVRRWGLGGSLRDDVALLLAVANETLEAAEKAEQRERS